MFEDLNVLQVGCGVIVGWVITKVLNKLGTRHVTDDECKQNQASMLSGIKSDIKELNKGVKEDIKEMRSTILKHVDKG
jgi:hypothetical protein